MTTNTSSHTNTDLRWSYSATKQFHNNCHNSTQFKCT